MMARCSNKTTHQINWPHCEWRGTMTAGDCRVCNWIRHNSIDCIIGKVGRVISRCGKETTWYIYSV